MSESLVESQESSDDTSSKVVIAISHDMDPEKGNIELFLENLDPAQLPSLLRYLADTIESEQEESVTDN